MPPICTTEGSKVTTCSRCNDRVSESVAALSHDYRNGTCSRCGDAIETTPVTTAKPSEVTREKSVTTEYSTDRIPNTERTPSADNADNTTALYVIIAVLSAVIVCGGTTLLLTRKVRK
jgi:hypothetical protein